MKQKLLLTVIAEERRHIYEEFLKNERVSFNIASSLREMTILAAKYPHCGILLDMPVLVKASQYDKSLAEDTLRALPCARLNISKKTGGISVLPIKGNPGAPRTASEFIQYCCSIPAKVVYIHNRILLNLNALLSKTPDMSGAVQTVSIDFSEGGCFLFTVDPELVPHTNIWIKFTGVSDEAPIQGMICWKREWGISDKIPGIGVRFDIVSEKQQAEILSQIAKKRAA